MRMLKNTSPFIDKKYQKIFSQLSNFDPDFETITEDPIRQTINYIRSSSKAWEAVNKLAAPTDAFIQDCIDSGNFAQHELLLRVIHHKPITHRLAYLKKIVALHPPAFRCHTISGLETWQDEGVEDYLRELSNDEVVKVKAMEVLALRGSSLQTTQLLADLENKDASVRKVAYQHLVKQAPDLPFSVFAKGLQDINNGVKRQALEGAVHYPLNEAKMTLLTNLCDSDFVVSKRCREYFVPHVQEVKDYLQEMLDERINAHVGKNIIMLLESMKDETMVPNLISAYSKARSQELKYKIHTTLLKLPTEDSVDFIFNTVGFKHVSSDVFRSVKFKGKEILLQPVLFQKDNFINNQIAAVLLQKVNSKKAWDILNQGTKSEHLGVAFACMLVLHEANKCSDNELNNCISKSLYEITLRETAMAYIVDKQITPLYAKINSLDPDELDYFENSIRKKLSHIIAPTKILKPDALCELINQTGPDKIVYYNAEELFTSLQSIDKDFVRQHINCFSSLLLHKDEHVASHAFSLMEGLNIDTQFIDDAIKRTSQYAQQPIIRAIGWLQCKQYKYHVIQCAMEWQPEQLSIEALTVLKGWCDDQEYQQILRKKKVKTAIVITSIESANGYGDWLVETLRTIMLDVENDYENAAISLYKLGWQPIDRNEIALFYTALDLNMDEYISWEKECYFSERKEWYLKKSIGTLHLLLREVEDEDACLLEWFIQGCDMTRQEITNHWSSHACNTPEGLLPFLKEGNVQQLTETARILRNYPQVGKEITFWKKTLIRLEDMLLEYTQLPGNRDYEKESMHYLLYCIGIRGDAQVIPLLMQYSV